MTQPLPRRSERRAGAPAGYEPVGVREWPAGDAEPYLPATAGGILPAVVILGWAAALIQMWAEDVPVPVWIAAVYASVGLLAAVAWLLAVRRCNRWFNAYCWISSRAARLRIPLAELPRTVREHPPAEVQP